MLLIQFALAQNNFIAFIYDASTSEPLIGATAVVKGTSIGAASALNGYINLVDVPIGRQTLVFSFVGFETVTASFNFPMTQDALASIYLYPNIEETEVVIINSSRNNRSVDRLPTRTVFLTG